MAGKPGRPKKVKETPAPVETKAVAEPKSRMSGDTFVAPPDLDREELYKQYFALETMSIGQDEMAQEIHETVSESAEVQNAEDLLESEVSAKVSADESAVEKNAAYVSGDDKPKEDEQKAEAPQEEPPVKAPDAKTVPLQALHEEREKRKQLQRELREAREARELYERQVHALYQAQSQPQVDESELSDYDKALLRLNQQNQSLAQQMDAIARAYDSDKQTRELQAISQNIQNTGQELEKEGFPHFNEMQDMVVSTLKGLYADDPENIYEYPDNPSGWKKAYKEVVYPKLQRFGAGTARTESFDAKKDLKKSAQLTGSTGKGAVPNNTKTNKEPSYQDVLDNYIKLRG